MAEIWLPVSQVDGLQVFFWQTEVSDEQQLEWRLQVSSPREGAQVTCFYENIPV